MILPLKKSYPVTQIFNDYRYRSSYTKFGLLGHNGVDYGVPQGTEIIAPHDGKITENYYDAGGYGNYIKIESDKEFSVLAHFKELSPLPIGKTVSEGDFVGLSGTTGNSTGPHLHWGYCYKPRNSQNGFNGYVDQQLVMSIEKSIPDLTKELQEMRESRDKWKAQVSDVQKNYEDLQFFTNEKLREKDKEIDILGRTVEDCRKDIELLQIELKKIKDAIGNNKTPLSSYTSKEIVDEVFKRLFGIGR